MNGKLAAISIVCGVFLMYPAVAEQVTVSGDQVYVTKSDCAALVTHHPSADVTYQPGADVHGKYVAPADLGGNDFPRLVPDKIQFPLQINPMNYAQRNAAQQQIAASSTAVVQNSKTLQQANAQKTQLSNQLTSLQSTQSQLATQQQSYVSALSSGTATIVAATGGANPTAAQLQQRQTEVQQLTAQTTGSAAYAQVLAAESANSTAITQTTSDIASQNQTITTATANTQPLQDQLTTAQGTAAGLQGKYDNTALTIARVAVDLKTGQTFLNGQPLTSQQEQIVSAACRKAGIR